ncbi:MAG: hypothetical protein RMI91_12945 [Gemmatales bacterium]|nr:hypothetical protein [Gemmatales bacterium]MDW7995550.1 hypothetical protein [Gemmatales bacterium]
MVPWVMWPTWKRRWVFAALGWLTSITWLAGDPNLPVFTEEREAAALTFVRRHYPDLLPLLERVRRSDVKRYQQEISEIFQLSEALTELRLHDERRYQLELEKWKTESKALVLVARLSTAQVAEKADLQAELRESARRLVELDLELLRLRIEELERELAEAREEMARAEERRDARIQERYQFLFDLARRRGMMR